MLHVSDLTYRRHTLDLHSTNFARRQLEKGDIAFLRNQLCLRSGRTSSYYLDKYRFETQPDVLAALGTMFAERITPAVHRIAGPELGAVALAAAASMSLSKSGFEYFEKFCCLVEVWPRNR